MNGKTLLPTILLASLLPALADERETAFDPYAPVKATTEWKPNPALLRELLRVRRNYPTVSIGKGDFEVSGPLLQTIRRPRDWSDLSLGRKILALPVINLLVPQPMPPSPGGGKYFAWGQSGLPWGTLAEGAAPGAGGFARYVNHEATGLISIGW
ncbi:MAG: hypothetical protein HY298_23200 [Verrucomicrobia bacterium]|nr:hypothetical protein [Verrucomicrobiota bacterium]